ncbi:MAG: hypothetical protein KF802_15625 [Bdellovibrionaceae bacterium]|nr:hypothetical protein [Pseudobdellovibrionaceae bacterium]MBX3033517.1 hypothetical protein [Pseudobdellovibrionaceae bacterium]
MSNGFRFGLEAEYLVMRRSDSKPLWHHDLKFRPLNEVLESIPLDGIATLDGLELEPPHTKPMPYVVEGYHVPHQDSSAADMQPKGLEIRTPVCDSVRETLDTLKLLHGRLNEALKPVDATLVALSHHPTEFEFHGPQNKRRHDFWLWAMEVMTTFGPDINVSVPPEMRSRIDPKDLEAKIDHYGPALSALSVASPFLKGQLWNYRGGFGHSYRMFKRSTVAPTIEFHPHEDGRLEFKVFDMTDSLGEFEAQILCFLNLLLNPKLTGRARPQSRIYDLGNVARFGLKAETVAERLTEFFTGADEVLKDHGFDPAALEVYRRRARDQKTPADEMISRFQKDQDLGACLWSRNELKA